MKELLWNETYTITEKRTEEIERIKPVLQAAVEYQKQFEEYLTPYSFWTDKKDRIYIRWAMTDDSDDRPVWRYFYNENNEFIAEKIKRTVSKKELLRGKNNNDQ